MKSDSEYKIKHHVNNRILEIEILGSIANTSPISLRSKIIDLIMKEKPGAVLVDIRTLKGRFKITEIYYEVREYPKSTPILSTAIVDLKEQEKFNSFLETTSQNMGLPTRWFMDIDSARDWLKSKL